MLTDPTGDPAPAKITVIIACKNAAALLPRCLESLAGQTLPPHQVVLKDALSNDGVGELPGKYPSLPIDLVSVADSGICDAWNQALDIATGDWVLFLGADDVLHAPDVLALASDGLKRVPSDVDIAYGQVFMVDEQGDLVDVFGCPWETASRGIRHWGGSVLPHQGAFHRRTVFQRAGKFDTSFRITGDYEFLRRILPQNPAVYIPSLVVADMRDGGISGQPKRAMQAAAEVRRTIRMHGKLRWQTQLVTLRCAATYALGMLFGDAGTIRLRQRVRRLTKPRPSKGNP